MQLKTVVQSIAGTKVCKLFHEWWIQTVYTLKCYFEWSDTRWFINAMGYKIIYLFVSGARKLPNRNAKMVIVFFLLTTTDGTWAIILYSSDKRSEFNIALSDQLFLLISSGPPYLFRARGQFDPTTSLSVVLYIHIYVYVHVCVHVHVHVKH